MEGDDLEVPEREISKARSFSLDLGYKAPYDWPGVLSFLREHRLPHVESVDQESYERVIDTKYGLGWFRVSHLPEAASLMVELRNGSKDDMAVVQGRVRRMFDLDADPFHIHRALSSNPSLDRIWDQHRGLRVARSWSGIELIFTAILGQLVSVKVAHTLVDELMRAVGNATLRPRTGKPINLFPNPEQIALGNLAMVRTSASRRMAILTTAKMIVAGGLDGDIVSSPKELRKKLLSVAGIGPWTVEYIVMRGFHDDDAFPATDYGLKQELKRFPDLKIATMRPLRAYAAVALWKSFIEGRNNRA